MNKAFNQALRRTVQASILAFLFWLGMQMLDWSWLIYLVVATLVFALISFVYTMVIWKNR
ncbi:hypothetical protein [Lacticaseibacillus jixiensis]|uniref:hypothetical protein n=1 Tax=Lacticaseibacillus jixiensis TaxID=3231926 RepID=UPI0036F30AE0